MFVFKTSAKEKGFHSSACCFLAIKSPSSPFWWAFFNSPPEIWGHQRKGQSLLSYSNCSGKLTSRKKNNMEVALVKLNKKQGSL